MRPRLLLSRVLLLAIYAVGLTLAWPWLGAPYARVFRASATAMCGTLSSMWDVRLEPLDVGHHTTDSTLYLKNRKAGKKISQEVSSRYIGYAPTCFMLALILATPLPWKRRGAALLWGFILIHAWIAVSIIVLVLHGYTRDNVVALYDVSPFVQTALAFLRETMVKAPVTKYTVPAVIWILVSFRRSDWTRLLGTVRSQDSERPGASSDTSETKRSSSALSE